MCVCRLVHTECCARGVEESSWVAREELLFAWRTLESGSSRPPVRSGSV